MSSYKDYRLSSDTTPESEAILFELLGKKSPAEKLKMVSQNGRERETQANEFASELLMPQWDVTKQLKALKWDNFFDAIETLAADTYDVSFRKKNPR
jgi:hypothetical protein